VAREMAMVVRCKVFDARDDLGRILSFLEENDLRGARTQ